MHRFYSTVALLAAAALMLPTAAGAQQKVVIGIPTSPPNIVHMPTIVAKELGLYKKSRPRRRYRIARRRREGLSRLAGGQYRFWPYTGGTDDYRPVQRSRGQSPLREPAEIRSLDGGAGRNQDDGRSERQAHRHSRAGWFRRYSKPQRTARGQDRSQGCQLRQHRK